MHNTVIEVKKFQRRWLSIKSKQLKKVKKMIKMNSYKKITWINMLLIIHKIQMLFTLSSSLKYNSSHKRSVSESVSNKNR